MIGMEINTTHLNWKSLKDPDRVFFLFFVSFLGLDK